MSLSTLTLRAMEKMFTVGDSAVVQFKVDGSAPMRALASDTTSILNAMRGKLDNKKRWQVAIIKSEIPAGKTVQPGRVVSVGAYDGKVEEGDFIDDCGVLTFFVS